MRRKFKTRQDENLVYYVARNWDEATGKWVEESPGYCMSHKEWKLYQLECELLDMGVSEGKLREFKDAMRAVAEEDERYSR